MPRRDGQLGGQAARGARLVAVGLLARSPTALALLEAIDDHDDVQSVHANYDIDDEVLAGYQG